MTSNFRHLYHPFSALVLLITAFAYFARADSILPLGDKEMPLKRRPEDAIPVIEVRGEGKPMSAAQIRELEEASNGGPLDIKITKTKSVRDCARRARRLDFVTFQYVGFLETGKRFDQTYSREPNGIRIQLGVGMVMPGLDKGLRGMCADELRKIDVPYRLSRKSKSRVWKHIPNEEHWLRFDVEVLRVEAWSIARQFAWMNANNRNESGRLTRHELEQYTERMRREYGKKEWPNEDIDSVMATRYYLKYFDVNSDGAVDFSEFSRVFRRDLSAMEAARKTNLGRKKKSKGIVRKRDPGLAWILDFNNDGMVDAEEMEAAPQMVEKTPKLLPKFEKHEEL